MTMLIACTNFVSPHHHHRHHYRPCRLGSESRSLEGCDVEFTILAHCEETLISGSDNLLQILANLHNSSGKKTTASPTPTPIPRPRQ